MCQTKLPPSSPSNHKPTQFASLSESLHTPPAPPQTLIFSRRQWIFAAFSADS
uniref:Uncharacterized protein n=1 Tax=Kalanchoe fedtschenkoi TaxID=63787 RepID=A0A7N0UAW2_KALFE